MRERFSIRKLKPDLDKSLFSHQESGAHYEFVVANSNGWIFNLASSALLCDLCVLKLNNKRTEKNKYQDLTPNPNSKLQTHISLILPPI